MNTTGDELPILYLDEHVVAISKPAGLLVHRTDWARGESDAALQRVRDQVGSRVYPVHRLDKPTSGVLLFARTPEAAQALAAQFAGNEVEKRYHAVVRGWTHPEGLIDHPLAATRDARRPGQPREATTAWRTLDRYEAPFPVSRYQTARYALVELMPRTGRTHQLRRHLKHVFHPIAGDLKYGDDAHNRFFEQTLGSRRLMLAAVLVEFLHPATGHRIRVECPPEASFGATVESLSRWAIQA